ncbi:MAG: amidohydrolase family protein [Blastocatellia bacterium]
MLNRILLSLFLLSLPQSLPSTELNSRPLAITNVTLIDATGKPPQPGMGEAKKLSIPVAGHAPESVSAWEVAERGQRSIEHVSPVLPGDAGIMLACSSQESQLRAEMFELKRLAEDKSADRQQLRQRQRQLQQQMAETRDQRKCADLFRLFVKNNVHAVPTQIWSKRFAPLTADDLPENEALKLAPQSLLTRWVSRRQQVIKASAAGDFAFRRLLFEKSRELVTFMHRARVSLLAGTDAMDGFVLPGLGLHEELALMVEAGLTPMEALQTATRNPAAFLGQSNSLGTIEKGKIADMVLLDADPLQNIANTRKIHAVIIGGKLITQTQRQEMLAKIESFARQH